MDKILLLSLLIASGLKQPGEISHRFDYGCEIVLTKIEKLGHNEEGVRVAKHLLFIGGQQHQTQDIVSPRAAPLRSDSLILDTSVLKALERYDFWRRVITPDVWHFDSTLMLSNPTEAALYLIFEFSPTSTYEEFEDIYPSDLTRERELNVMSDLGINESLVQLAQDFIRTFGETSFQRLLFQQSNGDKARFVIPPQVAREHMRFKNDHEPYFTTPPVDEHPAYDLVMKSLADAGVGKRGNKTDGTEDQLVIAQALLAPREPSAVPTLVVSDNGILKPLLRHFSPDFRGEKNSFPVRESYPNGFIIQIQAGDELLELKIQPLSS